MAYVLDIFVESQYATSVYFKKWHESHEFFLKTIINDADGVSVVDCSALEKLPPIGQNFYQQDNPESVTNTLGDGLSMFCFIKNEINLGYITFHNDHSAAIVAALRSNPTLQAQEIEEDQINVKFAERKGW